MEIKKRVITTCIGLSLVSMGAVSGELNSMTNEVQQRDFRDGSSHTEWTLGKGSYKLSDTYKFWFDVDRDFLTTKILQTRSVGTRNLALLKKQVNLQVLM